MENIFFFKIAITITIIITIENRKGNRLGTLKSLKKKRLPISVLKK